ncbi:hypothetical protein BHM03_00027751 [Ensete ventricosum]|nr:hypothetical protein BHM03_00027751 [Ensete ventricosum]
MLPIRVAALGQDPCRGDDLRLGYLQRWSATAKALVVATACGQAICRSGHLRPRAPAGRLRANRCPPVRVVY